MDKWVIVGPKMLEKQPLNEQEISEGQVKVRVSHVLVSSYDTSCYTGEKKIAYPKIPGRVALGIVTDAGSGCYGVQKGTRVLLNPVRPCGKCYACKSGNRADCTSPAVVVDAFDGFMRDFVVCNYYDVTPIPDSMDDLLALCIENVALAENIFDRLNLPTGGKIAIVGGGFFGTILMQVALYHKLVPIVIENNPSNVERLKRSGAYFTFSADDSLTSNVIEATSGSMCDAAIYTSYCRLSPSIAAETLARGKNLIFAGVFPVDTRMDTGVIFDKNLHIYGITDGYGYMEIAINMLMHGAIDISNLEKHVLKEFDLKALYDERAAVFSHTAKMTVLKLVL